MTITSPMTDQKSYYLGPGVRAFLLTLGVPLLLVSQGTAIFGMLNGDSWTVAFSLIFGSLMLLASSLPLFFAWYPRLRIGSEGIQVRGAVDLSTISIPWSNVERFLWKPGNEGIVLREPLATPAGRWLRKRDNDTDQLELLAQHRYVSIKGFTYWFRRGDLIDYVRRFAPAIAEDFQAQSSAYELTRKKNRRVLAVYFVFIGVVTSLVILSEILNW